MIDFPIPTYVVANTNATTTDIELNASIFEPIGWIYASSYTFTKGKWAGKTIEEVAETSMGLLALYRWYANLQKHSIMDKTLSKFFSDIRIKERLEKLV